MTIPLSSSPAEELRFAAGPCAETRTRPRTAWIFLTVVTLTLALTWFTNSHFLTREALQVGLAGRLSPDRIDAQYEQIQRNLWVSYAVAPVYVGVRIVLAALVMQLIFLARGNEIRIDALVHACTLAYLTVIASTTVDTWTVAHPASLKGLGSMQAFFPPTPMASVSFLLHSVSIFEIAWCAVLIALIKRLSELEYRRIATSVIGGWMIITGLQIAVVGYVARVIR